MKKTCRFPDRTWKKTMKKKDGDLMIKSSRPEDLPSKYIKASFTVELSLLIPLIFFIIFGLIYYDFLTQNRISAYCSAAEQAISGKTYENILTVGGEAVNYHAEENASVRKVRFSSGLRSAYGSLFREWTEEAEYQRLYPVDFIWQLKAAGELGKEK